jgi:transcriptional regulator with XRE-family HTH domain
MEDEKLKKQIGANIATYRKQAGLTQAGLAEKLNYSDKAVSKWERGESAPDVLTLVQLADLYHITVNDLLSDPDALPEESGAVQRVMEKAVEKTLKRKADKRIILNLSSLLVWFVAVLFFVVCSSLDIPNSWLAFIYALPADAIVRMTLLSAWKDYRWNQLLVSMLAWGCLLSLYVSFLVFFDLNLWRVFLLGIPGQLAIFLWFRMFRSPGKEKNDG